MLLYSKLATRLRAAPADLRVLAGATGFALMAAFALTGPDLRQHWLGVLLAVWGGWSLHSAWGLARSRLRRILVVAASAAVSSIAVFGSAPVFLAASLLLAGIVLQATRLALPRHSSDLRLAGHAASGLAVLCLYAAAAADRLHVNVRLGPESGVLRLVDADQRDRRTGRVLLDGTRDQRRLQRAIVLDTAGQLKAPAEKQAAALLLLHGGCVGHFRRAYQLASEARAEGLASAEPIARAAYDRWRLALGLPQKFHSQALVVGADAC